MVDLSKARSGDTVKFRCGGEAVIRDMTVSETKGMTVVGLRFDDEYGNISDTFIYGSKGTYTVPGSVLDVISVIPAPEVFDWASIKAGDCFIDPSDNEKLFFVGVSPIKKNNPIFVDEIGVITFPDVFNLTRAPEHDVEVG